MSRQSQYNRNRKRSVSPPWNQASPMRPHRNKQAEKGSKKRSRPRRLKSARPERGGSLPIEKRYSRNRAPSLDSGKLRYSPDSPRRSQGHPSRNSRQGYDRYERQTASPEAVRARKDAYNRREYKGHLDYQPSYSNQRGRHVSSPPGERQYSRSHYDIKEYDNEPRVPPRRDKEEPSDYGYNELSGSQNRHKDYAHTEEHSANMPGQYDRLPAEEWVSRRTSNSNSNNNTQGRYLAEYDAKKWNDDPYNQPGSLQSQAKDSPPRSHPKAKNSALEEEIEKRKALRATDQRPSFQSERKSRADSLDDDLRALRLVDDSLRDVDYRQPSLRVESPQPQSYYEKNKPKVKGNKDDKKGCNVM